MPPGSNTPANPDANSRSTGGPSASWSCSPPPPSTPCGRPGSGSPPLPCGLDGGGVAALGTGPAATLAGQTVGVRRPILSCTSGLVPRRLSLRWPGGRSARVAPYSSFGGRRHPFWRRYSVSVV
jgi:hypothetical protein